MESEHPIVVNQEPGTTEQIKAPSLPDKMDPRDVAELRAVTEAVNRAAATLQDAEAVRSYVMGKMGSLYSVRPGDSVSPDGTITRAPSPPDPLEA